LSTEKSPAPRFFRKTAKEVSFAGDGTSAGNEEKKAGD